LTHSARGYFVRKVGTDGFRIGYQPTLKKVVSDRRASLDEEADIKPAMRALAKEEFERGRTIPLVPFPVDGSEIQDTPKLAMVVLEASQEWDPKSDLKGRVADWTKQRGTSPRLYLASLVWCIKKRGRELREKVENMLAWRRVKREIDEGLLGGEFERSDRAELTTRVKDAEEAARDEVWASYRYAFWPIAGNPRGSR